MDMDAPSSHAGQLDCRVQECTPVASSSTAGVECARHVRGRLLLGLGLAQLLSLLLAVTGVTSQTLLDSGLRAPLFQSFLNYCLLAVVYVPLHLRASGPRLSHHWLAYALLSLLDVEGNFLVTTAYQYTSLTSVTLLDCAAVPAAMLLSAWLLRERYSGLHCGAAALCAVGLTVLVLTDGHSSTGGAAPALGDALVLCGAVSYAASNVLQQRLLRDADVCEVLATLGGFGVVVAGVQVLLLERDALSNAAWSPALCAPLAAFACALFTFYSLLPYVLRLSGAALLNVALLSSDLWAAAAREVLFGGFGGTAAWFSVSFMLETVGMGLYAQADTLRSESTAGSRAVAGQVYVAVEQTDNANNMDEDSAALCKSEALQGKTHEEGDV